MFNTPALTRFSGPKERVGEVCADAEPTQGTPAATSAAAAPNNRRRPWSMCPSLLHACGSAALFADLMFVLLGVLTATPPAVATAITSAEPDHRAVWGSVPTLSDG